MNQSQKGRAREGKNRAPRKSKIFGVKNPFGWVGMGRKTLVKKGESLTP
jgi:hypothetical protein